MLTLCKKLSDLSYETLERRIQLLLEHLGIGHLRAVLFGKRAASPDAARLWMKDSSGTPPLALSFERGGQQISRRSLFLLAPTFVGDSYRLAPTEEASEVAGEELLLELWADTGESRGTISLFAPQDPLVNEVLRKVPSETQGARQVTGLLTLALGPLPVGGDFHSSFTIPSGTKARLRAEGLAWIGALTLKPTVGGAQGAMPVKEFSLILKERDMSPQDRLQLTLELGSLEISMQEFLALRPGHSLVCEVPETTLGALRIGEQLVAAVSIRVGAEGVDVQIKKILTGPKECNFWTQLT